MTFIGDYLLFQGVQSKNPSLLFAMYHCTHSCSLTWFYPFCIAKDPRSLISLCWTLSGLPRIQAVWSVFAGRFLYCQGSRLSDQALLDAFCIAKDPSCLITLLDAFCIAKDPSCLISLCWTLSVLPRIQAVWSVFAGRFLYCQGSKLSDQSLLDAFCIAKDPSDQSLLELSVLPRIQAVWSVFAGRFLYCQGSKLSDQSLLDAFCIAKHPSCLISLCWTLSILPNIQAVWSIFAGRFLYCQGSKLTDQSLLDAFCIAKDTSCLISLCWTLSVLQNIQAVWPVFAGRFLYCQTSKLCDQSLLDAFYIAKDPSCLISLCWTLSVFQVFMQSDQSLLGTFWIAQDPPSLFSLCWTLSILTKDPGSLISLCWTLSVLLRIHATWSVFCGCSLDCKGSVQCYQFSLQSSLDASWIAKDPCSLSLALSELPRIHTIWTLYVSPRIYPQGLISLLDCQGSAQPDQSSVDALWIAKDRHSLMSLLSLSVLPKSHAVW